MTEFLKPRLHVTSENRLYRVNGLSDASAIYESTSGLVYAEKPLIEASFESSLMFRVTEHFHVGGL